MKFVLALLFVCMSATVSATGQPIDVAARAKSAAKIVVATVINVEPSRFDVNQYGDRIIATRAWLRVEEVLKGDAVSLLFTDVEGGSIGDLTLQVSDMPKLKNGDRGVFFLNAQRGAAHTLSGRGSGLVRIDAAGRVVNSNLSLADLKASIKAAL